MSTYQRGGKNLSTGDIGRFKVLRQHILLPGETVRPRISGTVKLSGLRQPSSVYLHASIEAFASPLRHYWDQFTEYLMEGETTSHQMPTLTGVTTWELPSANTSGLGIGKVTAPFQKFYAQHPINIFNEHYRFQDTDRHSVSSPLHSFYDDFGQPCVNLPSAFTRVRPTTVIDADVASATNLDITDLALKQATFEQTAKSVWTAGDSLDNIRYKDFMSGILGGKGSNEVDKVPIRLRKGASLNVKPSDQYATDSAGLGETISINNFNVNHKWTPFYAEEHTIIAYIMVLRFSPITDHGVIPAAYPAQTDYHIYQGDTNVIAQQKPVIVHAREVSDGTTSPFGKLPAGWQLREGFNHVDYTVAQLNNFPLLGETVANPEGARDASAINDCFHTTALRHYFCDLDFDLKVNSRVPEAGVSIMAGGTGKKSKPKGIHPSGRNI